MKPVIVAKGLKASGVLRDYAARRRHAPVLAQYIASTRRVMTSAAMLDTASHNLLNSIL